MILKIKLVEVFIMRKAKNMENSKTAKGKANVLKNFFQSNKKKLLLCLVIFVVIVSIAIIVLCFNKTDDKMEMCQVQFNVNGGLEIETLHFNCGESIKEPAIPEKDGFEFLGWYLDDQKFDFNTKIYENIIINAKWKAKDGVEIVVVSFDTDGGSTQDDIELVKGSYLVKPIDPTKEGYSFLGWYLDDQKFSFVSKAISQNITLKAKWQKVDENHKTEGDTSGNETIDVDDNMDPFQKYDELVNEYSGRWYLNGYEDIFLTVSRHEYSDTTAMNIEATNFSLISSGVSDFRVEAPFVKYPCSTDQDRESGCVFSNGVSIAYNNWNSDMEKGKVSLTSSSIIIGNNKFVRNKGSKNKYTGTTFEKALGTWYLYNKPDSTITIYSSGNADDVINTMYYCIKNSKFNLTTFEYSSSGSQGCEFATSDALFKKLGIRIENDNLIINNGKAEKTFFKTPQYVTVSGITLDKTSLNLHVGDTAKITATVSPSDAFNKQISWTSSDESVVTVNNGNIVTLKSGTATITATTQDGHKTASCTINVSAINVDGISLNTTHLNLIVGSSSTLSATITPDNATNKNVQWSSSEPSIVTVDNNGKVTAKKRGTAIITVMSTDGGYTASCTVNVTNPPLTAQGSIGIKILTSSGGTTQGVYAEIIGSGGTGIYTYYYIELYKDGVFIGKTTDTSHNSLFLSGYSNGNYTMQYELRDSDGTVITGSTSATMSGF